MLEFEIVEEILPNEEIINIFKQCKYKYRVRKGAIKKCLKTNIQFVAPTIYLMTYPKELIIHEYKINEISNKCFYIRSHNQKYNLKEIKEFLTKYGSN